MAGLPKNISIVQYKNADGTKQAKLRARLTVKGKKFDRLFDYDDMDPALAYLREAKSHFGRKAIDEADIAEQKAMAEFRRPPLGWFFNLYFAWKHPTPKDTDTILKKKQHATYKSFFKTISTTEFEVFNEEILSDTPHAAQIFVSIGLGSNISKKSSLGKLKLHEINYKAINAYIKKRLELGKSKISVRKEISILSCFYRDLKYVDTIPLKAVEDLKNPCKEIDPRLLANARPDSKAKRIDEANYEKYLNCLFSEDLDFAYASLLQYYGAFRMSEALGLTWENIDFKTKKIHLPQTKTSPRNVLMTKDLQDLLETIEDDKAKRNGLVLKTQTLYKYQKQIQRFRSKYGFELRTHQFRKDAISRMIDNVGTKNKILLAQILGYKNVKQFANDYIDETPSLETLEGVMKNAGHTESSINITSNNYYEPPNIENEKL